MKHAFEYSMGAKMRIALVHVDVVMFILGACAQAP